MTEEIWKPIVGFEGYYEISNHGLIRGVDRCYEIVKPGIAPYLMRFKGRPIKRHLYRGRYSVNLPKRSKYTRQFVAALVMEAFSGPRPEGCYVCHRDGCSTNDHLDNLYYGTPKQNSDDARRHGTIVRGSKIPWSHLTECDVKEIRLNSVRMKQAEISEIYKISQTQVSRIINNKQWQHVT